MPNKQHYYTPDQIDCDTMCRSIREEFNLDPRLDITFTLDRVVVVARCLSIAGAEGPQVQVQAVVSRPLKSARECYTMLYSALLDCWHQLDRGTLAVATAPMVRDWNGRPAAPKRHG